MGTSSAAKTRDFLPGGDNDKYSEIQPIRGLQEWCQEKCEFSDGYGMERISLIGGGRQV